MFNVKRKIVYFNGFLYRFDQGRDILKVFSTQEHLMITKTGLKIIIKSAFCLIINELFRLGFVCLLLYLKVCGCSYPLIQVLMS